MTASAQLFGAEEKPLRWGFAPSLPVLCSPGPVESLVFQVIQTNSEQSSEAEMTRKGYFCLEEEK